MAVLGKPVEVMDEPSFFRIADMYVVDKGNVINVENNGKILRIDYKNGDWFEFGICER